MEIILDLPLFLGIFVCIASISISGFFVAYISRKILIKRLTKQHERIGRLLFRVTAGLIALLVSLSYANERVRNDKIVDTMEKEASTLSTIAMRLHHFKSDQAVSAYAKIKEYVELTIKDDWKNIGQDPYFSKMTQSLVDAYYLVGDMPVHSEFEMIEKKMILSEISSILNLGQVRVYSEFPSTPYLIYILLCGLTFMWIFYAVYQLDKVSVLYLTLYNSLIAILIYFVFSLSNPFIGPLKVKPQSLIVVKTKGFDIHQK